MNVKFAVVSDAVNHTTEGKLNILGIFNAIGASAFPATHPEMNLVVSFLASSVEEGKVKELEIQLIGSHGKKVLTISGKAVVPKARPGYPVEMNFIQSLRGIVFEEPGDYAFVILVNGDEKGRASLSVVERGKGG